MVRGGRQVQNRVDGAEKIGGGNGQVGDFFTGAVSSAENAAAGEAGAGQQDRPGSGMMVTAALDVDAGSGRILP